MHKTTGFYVGSTTEISHPWSKSNAANDTEERAMSETIRISKVGATRCLNGAETVAEYVAASPDAPNPGVVLTALAVMANARGIAWLAKDGCLDRVDLCKTLAFGKKLFFETTLTITEVLRILLGIKGVQKRPADRCRRQVTVSTI